MIKNLAELLDQLRVAEKIKIDELGIKHRPTIGREYEGLTARLLDESLFKELDLKVIRSSFIKTSDGARSSEIDVMIIEGQGEEVLYSPGQYEVSIEQVIAIIQVKKVLNKTQIEEAYHNLKSVYDLSNFMANAPAYALDIFRDAYGRICLEDIVEGNRLRKTFSSTTQEQIFNILDYESMLPLRIVFAYEGYTSEYGLRKGFLRFLEENKSEVNDFKMGFGPINFPDLIINGDLSLIKANAMPYVGTLIDGQWPFYMSSSEKPILKLLEIIWTRLTYKFDILDSEIFGDDLDIEQVNPFLKANIVNISGIRAWNIEYVPLSKEKLEEELISKEWEPVAISEEQHHIITYLCKYRSIRISDINKLLITYKDEDEIQIFVDELIKTGLIYINKFELKLSTILCECFFVPNKGYYAADNKSGRLTRWHEKKFRT